MLIRVRWLVLVVSTAGLFGGVLVWRARTVNGALAEQHAGVKPPRVGDSAPDFVASDYEGKEWQLKRLRGRRVLLTFFCGCEPCRKLARELAPLASRWRGVQILVVSYLDLTAVPAFQRDTNLSAPFLMDPFGDVGARYDSLTCPRCWVIDERGRIRYSNQATISDIGEVVRHIERYLSD